MLVMPVAAVWVHLGTRSQGGQRGSLLPAMGAEDFGKCRMMDGNNEDPLEYVSSS